MFHHAFSGAFSMRNHSTFFAVSLPLIASVALVGFGHAWPTDTPVATPDDTEAAVADRSAWTPEEGSEVEAVVDHRQGAMSAVGGSMSALAAVVLDGAPYEDRLEVYAGTVEAVMTDLPDLFPDGSDHPESDALPPVWEDRETFEERAANAAQAARELAEAVESGDEGAMAQAFGGVGNACGACHEDFRN